MLCAVLVLYFTGSWREELQNLPLIQWAQLNSQYCVQEGQKCRILGEVRAEGPVEAGLQARTLGERGTISPETTK